MQPHDWSLLGWYVRWPEICIEISQATMPKYERGVHQPLNAFDFIHVRVSWLCNLYDLNIADTH